MLETYQRLLSPIDILNTKLRNWGSPTKIIPDGGVLSEQLTGQNEDSSSVLHTCLQAGNVASLMGALRQILNEMMWIL